MKSLNDLYYSLFITNLKLRQPITPTQNVQLYDSSQYAQLLQH